jgi:hypothetical protein
MLECCQRLLVGLEACYDSFWLAVAVLELCHLLLMCLALQH